MIELLLKNDQERKENQPRLRHGTNAITSFAQIFKEP
jgi:hypothetical protein